MHRQVESRVLAASDTRSFPFAAYCCPVLYTERTFPMDQLLNEAAARAIRYLDGLDARRVAPTPEAIADLKELDGPLPEEPTDPAAVLALLDDFGSPGTVATAGPRFFGFVIGGSLPVTVAANWLAGAWDQPAFAYAVSPTAATLEEIALRWLLDIFGLAPTCGGAFGMVGFGRQRVVTVPVDSQGRMRPDA